MAGFPGAVLQFAFQKNRRGWSATWWIQFVVEVFHFLNEGGNVVCCFSLKLKWENLFRSNQSDKYKFMAPIGVWLIMELFWFILKKKTSFSTVYCIRFGRLWGLETVKDTCVIKSWPKRAQIITDKSKLQI